MRYLRHDRVNEGGGGDMRELKHEGVSEGRGAI